MSQLESSVLLLPRARKLGGRPLTETERNFLVSAAIVATSVLLFAVIHRIEMGFGRWKDSIRFVLNPMETSMRYLSLSHFFVAVVYMLSSRRIRSARAWIQFAALLGAGLLLCSGYARLEAASLWIAGLLFFVFFLLHDYRDQVFFYRVNGDAPAGAELKALSRALFVSPFLLLAFLFCVASAAIGLGFLRVERVSDTVSHLSVAGRWAVALLPAAILAAAFPVLRKKFVRTNLGSLSDFLRVNRPIFFVFAAGLVLWTAGEIATGLPNTIVLLHVVTWYVFTDRMLRKRGSAPASARLTWAEIRNTTAGFRVLHIGSAIAIAILGVVWAYGFSNDPGIVPFRLLLAPENFRYWTILHVTVSFIGR